MKSPDKLLLSSPQNVDKIVLHTCCAPCSSAIIESLLTNNITPHIYFYNPNIYPKEEYIRRKTELIKYISLFNLPFTDAFYDYTQWLNDISGLEQEPERGKRCIKCFQLRMLATAQFAAQENISVFTTTLTSSRWKDTLAVFTAGEYAARQYPSLSFWRQDWKKGGLSERRSQIVKSQNFYNQDYCGCQFSVRLPKNIEKGSNELSFK